MPDHPEQSARTRTVLAFLACLAASRTQAQPIVEYPINGSARGVATDPDGVVLRYTTPTDLNELYRGASSSSYLVGGATDLGSIVAGPESTWIVDTSGNLIWRRRYSGGGFTSVAPPTSNSLPHGIAIGPDGNVWFTEIGGNKVTRLVPPAAMTEYPLPHASSGPLGITGGHDGKVWFVENNGNRFASLAVSSGTIVEHDLPTPNSYPTSIAASYSTVAFTETGSNQIGVWDLLAQKLTEYPVPTPASLPQEIVWGRDGAFWFTEFSGNKIGRFDPVTHAFTEFVVPTPGSQPSALTVLGNGDVAFAEAAAAKIAVVRLHVPGDENGDGLVTAADVFYLIDFLFAAGPAPL